MCVIVSQFEFIFMNHPSPPNPEETQKKTDRNRRPKHQDETQTYPVDGNLGR